MSNILILSPTGIAEFLRCPAAYEFYTHGVRDTGYASALVVGGAVHAGIAGFRSGVFPQVAMSNAAENMRKAYVAAEESDKDSIWRDATKVHAMLLAYPFQAERVKHVEVPREVKLNRCTILHGIFDGEDDDYVWETKTCSDTCEEAAKIYSHDIQILLYQVMVPKPVMLDIVKKPVTRTRKGENIADFGARCLADRQEDLNKFYLRREVAYNESDANNAKDLALRVAKQIRECGRKGFPRITGKHCYGKWPCRYQTLCWYGGYENYQFTGTREQRAEEEKEIEENGEE